MKKSWILILALVLVFPAALLAQKPGGNKPHGGSNPPAGGSGTTKPEKVADLAADSITAKWKDAKTLEITCTIKNASTTAYSGTRTVSLKITGKDGKPESAKEESLPTIAASGSHTFKFEATDKKYFDKDLKWTLEISAGDDGAANDKKTKTLSPGPQPKG